jgi:hypothetical protein
MKNAIFWFVKIFEDKEYADQFIEGKLFLNRIRYFKKIEEDDYCRCDKEEAMGVIKSAGIFLNLVLTVFPYYLCRARRARPNRVLLRSVENAKLWGRRARHALSYITNDEFPALLIMPVKPCLLPKNDWEKSCRADSISDITIPAKRPAPFHKPHRPDPIRPHGELP